MCSGRYVPGNKTTFGSGKIGKRVGNSSSGSESLMTERYTPSAPREPTRVRRPEPGARARAPQTAPPRGGAGERVRPAARLDRSGERARAQPFRDLLCGRPHQDPAPPPARPRPAQVLGHGRHALPRTRAPAPLRPRSPILAAVPADSGIRPEARDLQAGPRAGAWNGAFPEPARRDHGGGAAEAPRPGPARPVLGLADLVVLLEGVRAGLDVGLDVLEGDGLVQNLRHERADRELVVLRERILQRGFLDREPYLQGDVDGHGTPYRRNTVATNVPASRTAESSQGDGTITKGSGRATD